jgi:solute carrier family 25 carnitine/acylcarnitine transporter 20/29
MVTYFCCIDTVKRKRPETFKTIYGQFLVSSCSATLGFWMVWPLEVLKNQVQADMSLQVGREYRGKSSFGRPIETIVQPTLLQRAQYLISTHGVRGLYRGILPGTIRSFLSNGFSMVVMLQAHAAITALGLRV